MRKKRVLFHSDFALSNSGFGKNTKAVLSYLYSLDKYEIMNYCCGMAVNHSSLSQTPWLSTGTLPDNVKDIEFLKRDPDLFRKASYGSERIDECVNDFKPDVYIAAQDIWGVDYSVAKPWFPKISSAVWTTLDSLPILPSAVQLAPKIKNYWIWSDFATKALHELGHKHVKTLHGAIDTKDFYRLNENDRALLRRSHQISSDDFIVGFVFRNQLRKSVPNLLEGFKKFKNTLSDKTKGAKLLLHTSYAEGWNILRLSEEYGVDPDDVLTTLVCKHCNSYSIHKFVGQSVLPCNVCGAQKAMVTTNIEVGVKETQLNEIYNLMDVYCHPFTSGGQEIPIQEAKLTELITLVTNYSCGEAMCTPEACSIPLDYSEYREHNTEFRKASTDPNSIADALSQVYSMTNEQRLEVGKNAREFVLSNFSKQSVGAELESFIDSSSFANESTFSEGINKDYKAELDYNLDDDQWVKSLYKNILDRDVGEDDDGYKYWIEKITDEGDDRVSRAAMENFFRQTAKNELFNDMEFHLDESDNGRRILFIMPNSASEIFLITSLFESAKETYPDCNIYAAVTKEYRSILDGNPYLYKVIPYSEKMDDVHWLEGSDKHLGFFRTAFPFNKYSQMVEAAGHQGRDKILFDVVK